MDWPLGVDGSPNQGLYDDERQMRLKDFDLIQVLAVYKLRGLP
jgi:hypothetical protein